MGLKPDALIAALKKYQERHGWGAWSSLSKISGISSATIGRIAATEQKPQLETWEKLHTAAPDIIPPPQFEGVEYGASGWSKPMESNASVDKIPLRRVPVFNGQAGKPAAWTDGGFPVGESDEYTYIDYAHSDENTFGIKIHGDSMSPTLVPGDIVIVVPSAELENGKLCFASFPGEDGDRIVKRYRRSGTTVILESDNREYDPIILTDQNGKGVRVYRIRQVIKTDV